MLEERQGREGLQPPRPSFLPTTLLTTHTARDTNVTQAGIRKPMSFRNHLGEREVTWEAALSVAAPAFPSFPPALSVRSFCKHECTPAMGKALGGPCRATEDGSSVTLPLSTYLPGRLCVSHHPAPSAVQFLVMSGYCDTSHGFPIHLSPSTFPIHLVLAANTMKTPLPLTAAPGSSQGSRARTFSFPHVTPAAATHSLWASVIISLGLQDGLSSCSLLAAWIHPLRLGFLPEARTHMDEVQGPLCSGAPGFLCLALSTPALRLCFLVSPQPLPRRCFPLSLAGLILGMFFSFRF